VTAEEDALRAEEERRWNECYARIEALAREIYAELDNDDNWTWAMFANFAEAIKPPARRGRPPKRSNHSRDRALIKAYREAPHRERRARVAAAGAAYRMSPEAAWAQLRRLRDEERATYLRWDDEIRPQSWSFDEDK
jgi:hypothetical protein